MPRIPKECAGCVYADKKMWKIFYFSTPPCCFRPDLKKPENQKEYIRNVCWRWRKLEVVVGEEKKV